jgi:PAS domain S-box-containing protein
MAHHVVSWERIVSDLRGDVKGKMIRLQSPLGRYGLAAVSTLAVFAIYLLSHAMGVSSDLRYFVFTLAVLVSALIAGLGPGLLATGLAALIIADLLLPPIFSPESASKERLGLVIFFSVDGALLSLIGSMIRKAKTAENAISWKQNYFAAFLFVSAGTGLKFLLLRDMERELPFAFFYAAIAGSAWAGGLSAGIAATILATLSARYCFLDPQSSLSVFPETNGTRMLLFIVEGIGISFLSVNYLEGRSLVSAAVSRARLLGRRPEESVENARALRAICGESIWELPLVATPKTASTSHVEQRGLATDAIDLACWLKEVHPKDRLNTMASLRSALDQGRTEWCHEYRRRRPGRGYVHVSDHAYIIRDDAWRPVRVVARSSDQTELKHGSFGVESEGPYRAFFENSPHAILLADKGWRIIEANDAACHLLRYRKAELKRLNGENLFEDRKRGLVMHLLLGLDPEIHPSIVFEEDCLGADGDVFRAKISVAVISEIQGGLADRMITIEIPDPGPNG